MDGTSTFGRIGTAAGILLLGACALLGGCNKQNKQLELAQQEAAELREKNVELDTRLRERDTRIAELEGRLSQVSASPSGDRGYTPPREPWSDRRTTSGGYQTETFTVSGDVLFDSGQATLKATAKKELDRVAAQIRSKHPNASVTVNGYTDSDPIRKSKWGSCSMP
jgi:chemotaxis protein MotB